MYLITKWFGTFLCSKSCIQQHILFPKKEDKLEIILEKIKNNEVLTEEKKLAKGKKVIVNEQRLEQIGEFIPNDPFFKKISIEPIDHGFSQELFQKVTINRAKKQMDVKLSSLDLQVVQMINALDDLIQISNMLSERLDCWSAIPTSKKKIKPFKTTHDKVEEAIKQLEKELDADMEIVAPNIQKIAGSLIGARLISFAGNLERLALMPSSTIQLLGAEQALFRFKKEGGKPPKHGVIFQHSLINRAQRQNRGKIARVMAAKISIAAKADMFTKRDIASELLKDMNVRIKEIVKK